MEYKLHDIVRLKKYPKPRHGEEIPLVGNVYGVVSAVRLNDYSTHPDIYVYVRKEDRTYKYPPDTVRLERVHRFSGDKPKEVTLKFKAVYWNNQLYLKIDKDRSAALEMLQLNVENIVEVKDMEVPKKTVTYEPILKPIVTNNEWGYSSGYFDTPNDDFYLPTIEQIEQGRDYNQEPF